MPDSFYPFHSAEARAAVHYSGFFGSYWLAFVCVYVLLCVFVLLV
jgi:hypothetical protein